MNEQERQACREALRARRDELIDLTGYDILDGDSKRALVEQVAAIDAALAAIDAPQPTVQPTMPSDVREALRYLVDHFDGPVVDTIRPWLDASAQEGHCVPDWSNAPEWAQWWAVDPYGESMWYEEEPLRYETVTFCGWGPKVEYGLEIGMKMGANVVEIPLGIDWRMLKFRRTREMAK